MMHDDAMFESVALLALGVLGHDEALAVRRAIESDPALREEYRRLRGAADLLGYAAESNAVDEVQSARMKARLHEAIGESRPTRSARRPRVAWLAWTAAAAGFALALFGWYENVELRDDLRVAHENGASLQTRVDAETKLASQRQVQLADLFAPDARHYAVTGGEVIARGDHVYIAMRDLPRLPRGKVFQAWTLASGDKAVAPSVTFTSGDGNSVVVALPPQQRRLAAVAVSIEPEGGSKAPTTKPLWVRPLS
jgi:anti-sigma-K factor RskA